MDAAVGHQLLERQPRDLATDRIEAGDDDRVRRVVDDHVDAGRQLERADVPALAPDDAALHLVVGQRDGGHGDLRRVLGGDPLDGERDDLLRLALGVPARASRESRGAGWPRRPAPPPRGAGSAPPSPPRPTCRPALEPAALLADEPVELLLALGDRSSRCRPSSLARRPTLPSRCSSTSDLRSSALSRSCIAPLLALDLFAAAARLDSRQSSRSLISSSLPEITALLRTDLGLALGVARRCASRSPRPSTSRRAAARAPRAARRQPARRPKRKSCRQGDDEHAKRGNECRSGSYRIYAPPRRSAAETGKPRLTRGAPARQATLRDAPA